MIKCPYCAEEIQDEAIKCKHCGEFIVKKNDINYGTCSDCGEALENDGGFCSKCGILKLKNNPNQMSLPVKVQKPATATKLIILAVVFIGIIAGYEVLKVNWNPWFVYPEYYASVKKHLKDPESVTFRNQVLRKNGFFCGEFNAKNSSGGYVGFKRFKIETRMLSINNGVSIEGTDIISSADMLEKVTIMCEIFGERKKRVDLGELKPLTMSVSKELDEMVNQLATEKNWKRDCVD
jgi:zinc ribbon protein